MPFNVMGRHNNSQRTLDFSLYDISAGINKKKAPQELNDNELTIGTNGYLRDDGGFIGRLGVARRQPQFNTQQTAGTIRFYQNVVSAVPLVTPKVYTLAQSGGTLFDVDRNVTYGGAGALGPTGGPWSAVQVYDPNRNGGTDVLVICTGNGGPYIFDGTVIYTPANWTTNIPGARFVQLINGILWFGGIPGQPTFVFGSQLFGSAGGGPEFIPFYNELQVSRTITGLGVIGAGSQAALAVGMTQGISLIVGTGAQNFTVIEMPSQDGPVSYRAMITVDGILYYQGQVAMYRCDGYSIYPISNPVEPWILNDPTAQEFPMNGDRTLCWTMYYRHKIYFWYDSGNTGVTNTALVYDMIRTGWTIYRGSIAFSCGAVLNAPGDPDPPQFIVGDANSGIIYNFEVSIPQVGIPEAYWPTSDDGASIFVQCQTKFFKIGQPGTPKTLLRVYPEIFATIAQPGLGIATDYAVASTFDTIPIAAEAAMTWGTSLWGPPTTWATAGLSFTALRIDFNLQAEAFAFVMQSNDMNPPWRWVGLTGVFSQNGKV